MKTTDVTTSTAAAATASTTVTTTATTIVTVSYDDLIAFDKELQQLHTADDTNTLRAQEINTTVPKLLQLSEQSQVLMKRIGYDAFGNHNDALGIVVVSNVPNFIQYRNELLPLAYQLSQLPDDELSQCVSEKSLYSVGWSHGKEVLSTTPTSNDSNTNTTAYEPDIYKGSYYGNVITNDIYNSLVERDGYCPKRYQQLQNHPEFYSTNVWPSTTAAIPNFETAFCRMGQLLHHVGLLIATVCDTYCSFYYNGYQTYIASYLQKSINANGRLLHYFPMKPSSSNSNSTQSEDNVNVATIGNNDNIQSNSLQAKQQQTRKLWCSWHNDHGSLTGLVPSMYIDTRTGNEVTTFGTSSTNGGLYIQPRDKTIVPQHVVIPKDCCAYQIGETSQLMSGGIFQATPHAVMAPSYINHNNDGDISQHYISRESFALFMEPEFDDIIHSPLQPPPSSLQYGVDPSNSNIRTSDTIDLYRPLGIRPLSERYRIGQTFGEFHCITTNAFTATD